MDAQVSANYQKIADGFSNALLDISSGLDSIRRELQDFDSPIIRELLVDLYVKFFKFLTHALSFFCSKKERIKASVSKTFYDKNVDGLVKDVWKTIQKIHEETRRITQGRIRDVDHKVDGLDRKLDLMIAAVDNRNGDGEDLRQKLVEMADALLPMLGFKVAGTLGAVEQQSMHHIEGEPAVDELYQSMGAGFTDCSPVLTQDSIYIARENRRGSSLQVNDNKLTKHAGEEEADGTKVLLPKSSKFYHPVSIQRGIFSAEE